MVNMPMNLLGTSVAQVYYAEIAKYGKSRPDKILKLSLSIVKKMFFIGIIPIGAIMVAGPWMFGFVFGAEWHDACVYAMFMSLLILSRFVSTPIMHCLNVLEKQLTQLLINTIRVISTALIFIVCSNYGLSSENTIIIYSPCSGSILKKCIYFKELQKITKYVVTEY